MTSSANAVEVKKTINAETGLVDDDLGRIGMTGHTLIA